MKVSIIIPTHNRLRKLQQLLDCLRRQDATSADYEIIIVDDNSVPPVELQEIEGGPDTLLIRLGRNERSAARNTGAEKARGDVLIFVDDDMKVGGDFISNHRRAHERHAGALVVGSVRLPREALETPFGRFRQEIEDTSLPHASGPTSIQNFCTVAHMSIVKGLFEQLGRFDASISSGEDQDLALRHTERGGQIVFVAEAAAVHDDDALDIRSYCRRVEWGAEQLVPFCQRYPDWPDNVERAQVNGPLRLGREPARRSVRKLIKLALRPRLAARVVFAVASLLESVAPESRALNFGYRL